LSIYAYIARNQHEVVVEEKQKRDEVGEGLSKRANKKEKAQLAKLGPETPKMS